jgi:hypothetical protein
MAIDKLPPLPEPTSDPERSASCALCQDSGWKTVYELATWRWSGRVDRKQISRAQYENWKNETEGLGRREIYAATKPCDCSKGQTMREAYAAADAAKTTPLPQKPAGKEHGDGKSKAAGE